MLFNSFEFLVFFLLVFIAFWFVFNRTVNMRNLFLLTVSYVFYGWWDWRFLSLIIISSFVDYWVGINIERSITNVTKKKFLWVSLAINLGFLGVFKYYNFFASSLQEGLFSLLGYQVNALTLSIVLPVGISFYTFQTMSYSIDVYHGKIKPTKDIITFFAYVSFFPQLVAGPIERASHLLPQLSNRLELNSINIKSAALLILWGYFKKSVIADRLALVVDHVFSTPHSFNGIEIAIANFFFSFQIFCDFSGYSDIAIGVAALLGISLMDNFKAPYHSRSISEFWQRWHISLSTWFRDYLYIPLGGNRVVKWRWYYNLMITFMVSGLWHGANWTFVVWGGLHGLYLILEKILGVTNKPQHGFKAVLRVLFVFVLVYFSWLIFRANTLDEAFFMFKKIVLIPLEWPTVLTYPKTLLTQLGNGDTIFGAFNIIMGFSLIIALELVHANAGYRGFGSEKVVAKINGWGVAGIVTVILLFGVYANEEFIYFQF